MVDSEMGRRIDRSMTIRSSRADAERELTAMITGVQATRAIGVRSTVSELLEAWFAVARTGWAPTTIRQTRSVLDRYLLPHLGQSKVGEVTPAMTDAAYAQLHCSGGKSGRPLSPGTLARIHVVLRSAFSQAMRWGWIWDNPAERAHRITAPPPSRGPRHPTNYVCCWTTSPPAIRSCTPSWCSPQ